MPPRVKSTKKKPNQRGKGWTPLNSVEYLIQQVSKLRNIDSGYDTTFADEYRELKDKMEGSIFDCIVHEKQCSLPSGITIKPTPPFERFEEFVFAANDKLPFPKMYEDGKQGLAGMGLIHVFALPVSPIYNIIDIDMDIMNLCFNMEVAARDYFGIRKNRKKMAGIFINKIGKENLDKKFNDYISDDLKDNNSAEKTIENMFDDFIDDFNPITELGFYFHVHPKQSVPYLHMHIVTIGRFKTSTMHDNRNLDFLDISMSEDLKTLLRTTKMSTAASLPYSTGFGKKKPQSYKKTDIKKEVGGRMRTIYKDSKGSHYVKCTMNGKTTYKKYSDAVKAAAKSKPKAVSKPKAAPKPKKK